MNERIVGQLISLNKEFYSKFASEFSNTRRSEQINLEHIVAYFRDGVKVLDIGCGNGRYAERLDRARLRLSYIGIDAAPELIAIAEERSARLQRVRAEFRIGDLSQSDWSQGLPEQSFDVVLACAVLHHIPSYEMRKTILREIRRLLAPRGVLIMTNWQFDRNERLRKKIVAWSTVGIDGHEIEPGDALITWKRGGQGYRYCHLITQNEIERLARDSGFRVAKQFLGDSELNLYSILSPIYSL